MICEIFGCTPDVAEQQNPALVEAILEYRDYRQAIEWYYQGPEGRARLGEHPSLMLLLKEVDQAQGFTEARTDSETVEAAEEIGVAQTIGG